MKAVEGVKKPLKPSQALLNAAKTRKQIFGTLLEPSTDKIDSKPSAYCALGAIYCETGVIHTRKDIPFGVVYSDYEFFSKTGLDVDAEDFNEEISCPDCISVLINLSWFIVHLNDEHKYSFEKIAEMLRDIGF